MEAGPLRLGPFALTVPIARGAMGEVWRGFHVARQVPVAVKVVRQRVRELGSFTQIFRTEARRMARLDHPGIVLILDHGEVTPEASLASDGRLLAGEPWLAMEYASGGSLAQAPPSPTWEALSGVLADLLDALAYAHAHGLLHRDIKPANVLRGTELDLRPGLKLADFGIAYAMEEEHDEGGPAFAGTPIYMAPEQIRGTLRDQGPWTDLYSLGGMAWRLVTGHVVFEEREQNMLLRAQLERAPGTFEPLYAVPAGFEAWLRVLLAKDPRDRFSCAADAQEALSSLGRPVDGKASAPHRTATQAFDETWSFGLDEVVFSDTPPVVAEASEPAERQFGLPPFPPDWRRPGHALPVRLVGAGLGLYGLRALPMVDRHDARNALWGALRDVFDHGKPRAVLLRGPVGLGKSRLAEWVACRADELGVAVPLRASHGPTPGRRSGVPGLLRRLLRVEGLDAPSARLQVHTRLAALGLHDPADARGLLAWMGGWVDGQVLPPVERASLFLRLLNGTRNGRPALLVVDDAWWGPEALRLAHAALTQAGLSGDAPAVPILVVVTCRDGAPSAATEAEGWLQRLVELPATETVDVGPLPEADVGELVRELLVLDESLVESVRARAGGSPLFAIQLVGDWVRRGVLDVAEDGFILREGERARIPDDIHVVWQDRVGLALGNQATVARRALELAAVIAAGAGSVDPDEWRRACELLGVPVPDDLVDALARARLVQPEDTGWCFAHSMLRESIERVAVEEGDVEALHRACAAMLVEAPPGPGRDERLGLHRLAAGEPDGALTPLLDGAEAAHRLDRFARALELLHQVELARDAAETPPNDPRLGRLGLLRLRVLLGQGRLAEADAAAARLAQEARRRKWPAVQAEALRFRGMAAIKQGDLLTAEATLSKALGQARRAGLGAEVATTLMHLGTLARMRGERDASLELLQEAREGFLLAEDRIHLAECLVDLAATHSTLGDPASGATTAREAAAVFAELGNQTGEGICQNILGDALRKQGDVKEAARAYKASRTLLVRTGSHARMFPLLNLGVVFLQVDRASDAVRALDTVLREAQALGDRVVEAYARGCGAAAHAALREWARCAEHLAEVEGLLAETGIIEPDLAGMLERAAQAAAADGRADLAEQAGMLAGEQWRALGDDERADAAESLGD